MSSEHDKALSSTSSNISFFPTPLGTNFVNSLAKKENENVVESKGNSMDNNEWQKLHIESVDRQLAEMRKESSDNRRELKSDIHSYITAVNKKIDDSIEESRNLRNEMKSELTELNDEFKSVEDEVKQTNRHVNTMMITMIVGLAGIFLAFVSVIIAIFFNVVP